jgi:hypothetical protein
VSTGVISDVFGTHEKDDIKDISSSLQNFLICIEMFLAAIAHHYAFSYKPYVDMAAEHQTCFASFIQMWDVSDVKQDLEEHIGVISNTALIQKTNSIVPAPAWINSSDCSVDT